MPESRRCHCAVVLPDGTIMVAGGSTSVPPHASADLFDPGPRTCRVLDPMPEPRENHALVLVEGSMLVIGGFTRDSRACDAVLCFDLKSSHWSVLSPAFSLHTARAWHSACSFFME